MDADDEHGDDSSMIYEHDVWTENPLDQHTDLPILQVQHQVFPAVQPLRQCFRNSSAITNPGPERNTDGGVSEVHLTAHPCNAECA